MVALGTWEGWVKAGLVARSNCRGRPVACDTVRRVSDPLILYFWVCELVHMDCPAWVCCESVCD